MILPGILPRDGQVDVDGDAVGDFASPQSMLAGCHSLLRLDLRRSSWRWPDEPTGGAAGYHPAGSPRRIERCWVRTLIRMPLPRQGLRSKRPAHRHYSRRHLRCSRQELLRTRRDSGRRAEACTDALHIEWFAATRDQSKRAEERQWFEVSLRALVSSWRSGQTSPYWMLREGMSRWCCSRARKAIAVHARPRCLGHPGTSRHGVDEAEKAANDTMMICVGPVGAADLGSLTLTRAGPTIRLIRYLLMEVRIRCALGSSAAFAVSAASMPPLRFVP